MKISQQPLTSVIRPNTYTLDKETIKLNAYRLLCLFYANKEIARLSEPDDRNNAASQLEQTFFAREMTRVLLNIAIGVRVLDDQMTGLTQKDPTRQAYFRTLDEVNQRHHCMGFDQIPLSMEINSMPLRTVRPIDARLADRCKTF